MPWPAELLLLCALTMTPVGPATRDLGGGEKPLENGHKACMFTWECKEPGKMLGFFLVFTVLCCCTVLYCIVLYCT